MILLFKHWTIGILVFTSLISIDLFITGTVDAAEQAGKLDGRKSTLAKPGPDVTEKGVKCKEEIEQALRKLDKEKGSPIPDDDEDDSEDSEDDKTTEKDVKGSTKKEDDDDEDEEEDTDEDVTIEEKSRTKEDDEDDEDQDDDEDDEDVTEEESEDEEVVTTPSPKAKVTTTTPPVKKPEVKVTTTVKPLTTTVKPIVTKTTPEPPSPPPSPPVRKVEPTKKPEVVKKSKVPEVTTKKPGKVVPVVVESDEDSDESVEEFKSRSQVEDILKLYEIGTKTYLEEQGQLTATFKDLKRVYESSIKPLEQLYKYKYISSRLITDAEIFSKPMVLLCGPKSSGKSSLVNYLLGVESSPWMLKTGANASPTSHFTIVEYGDSFSKLSPMEISADFAFSNLQQFGQHFLENHLEAFRMPLSILQRITIVDSPGLVDSIISKAPEPGKSIDSEVYQWFVDRADIIYIVVESTQVHLTQAMKDLLEQLKGRDVRFIISKSEMITQTQAVMLIGQLLWSLSPVMPSDTPPQVYALTTSPVPEYNPFLDVQEEQWLSDLSRLISGVSRVESRAAAIRRHAVRVRNHAKVIDCYLSAFYKRKPMFSFGNSAKKLATAITENPHDYNIFKGALAGVTQNVSRYDLPDPDVYREFFRVHPLMDFKQLSATCSFFGGCPIDKLDVAIAYRLPDLVAKYKKLTAPKKDKKGSPTPTPGTTKGKK